MSGLSSPYLSHAKKTFLFFLSIIKQCSIVSQGEDKGEMSRSACCNCPYIMTLRKGDDDSWFVKRFVDQHNHPMSISCGEKRRWPSHSRIDGSTRELIRHLRSNNVQLCRVCSIVGSVHHTDSYVPFSQQSVRTLCAKLAQESIEGDMAKTLEVFSRIKKKNLALSLQWI
jgi:hypothetical protein